MKSALTTLSRRAFTHTTLASVIALAWQQAHALSLQDLTATDASAGVKAALEKGALSAVSLLGQPGGFLNRPEVRIGLPDKLASVAKLMRKFGQGKRVDALEAGMNRAAEAAVPVGKEVLVGAVKSMTVEDAKQILTGGDTSVTQFFANKARLPLGERFLPIVTEATAKVDLAQTYNDFAGRAAKFGVIDQKDANLQQYVTDKTLDGLFLMIGEEEKKIRKDPVGTGSELLRKVFGGLK